MEYEYFSETTITSTCILVMILVLSLIVLWIRVNERKENAANRNKELEKKKTIGGRIHKEVEGLLPNVIVLLLIINKCQFNIVTYVLFAIVAVFYVYDVYRGVVTHDEKKKFWGLFSIAGLVLMYILVAYTNCVRCS